MSVSTSFNFAFVHQSSSKSDELSLRYGVLAIFQNGGSTPS